MTSFADEESDALCILCRARLSSRPVKRLAVCDHAFHEDCITQFLATYDSRVCPLCGASIHRVSLVPSFFARIKRYLSCAS